MSTGCLILLSAACLHQAAKVPTAAELMKLAPDIKSGTGKYRTIRFSGYFKEPGSIHLRYQATYRASGDFSLVISDGTDGTPLLYCTAREVLFHDPTRPVVIYSKSLNMTVGFAKKDGKINLSVNGSNEKQKPENIHLDLKSLFVQADDELFKDEVVDTGDQTYRLIRVNGHGNTLACCVDLKQPCPFTSVKRYAKGEHQPNVALDLIVVDGPVGDDDFRFPDIGRLAKLVPFRDDSDGGIFRAIGDLVEIMGAFRTRSEAYHPANRPTGLRALVRRVDWDEFKANDQKFAAAIKATLRTIPANLPELPPDRPVVVNPQAR